MLRSAAEEMPSTTPHVGVTRRVVFERDVGDVAVQEQPRPADDCPQHVVDLTESGKVVGGFVERTELGLAATSLVNDGADTQGEGAGTFELGDNLGSSPRDRAAMTGPSNSTGAASRASSSSNASVDMRPIVPRSRSIGRP
jgi:hypothetical protein